MKNTLVMIKLKTNYLTGTKAKIFYLLISYICHISMSEFMSTASNNSKACQILENIILYISGLKKYVVIPIFIANLHRVSRQGLKNPGIKP